MVVNVCAPYVHVYSIILGTHRKDASALLYNICTVKCMYVYVMVVCC